MITIASMGIDPGGTTGLALVVCEKRATLKESLATATGLSAIEVMGDWQHQAEAIGGMMVQFRDKSYLEGRSSMICIENFVLRRRQEGGATGNLTSIWVAAGAWGYYRAKRADGDGHEPEVAFPMPSQAKSFATDERLKMWGCYVTGAHKRDAMRHAILGVNELLG